MSKEFDYSKIRHITSVDQSDRKVPYNLRQSGPTKVELLISTRVRKSPYWHLSMRAGCWRATVYNRIYHPRGYVKPEDGGAMKEYDAIKNHVTMWNVAVERQIRVKGPDAEKFVDYVITRDATKISPMRARYVILCNSYGGVLNDPILLRISKNEFWFSLSDSDISLYLQGVNCDGRFNCEIDEIDVKGKTNKVRIFEVFQWESKKIRDKKLVLTPIFNKALEQYRKNDLINCRKQLKKYEKLLPNDPILGLYLDRCKN